MLITGNALAQGGSTQCPTLSPGPTYILCQNPNITISALLTSSNTMITFSWAIPATASVSGTNSKNITTNATGVYTVTAYNTVLSCSASMQYTISGCVGINEEGFDTRFNVKAFPNPCADTYFINTDVPLNASFYNVSGQLMLERRYEKGNHSVDAKNWSSGLYFLKLEIENYTQTLKIVKTN